MQLEFEITDADIQYAESILLPLGCRFDHERKEFIKNLATLDLQAVPGSGKTTALLAKLLIIEQKLPFKNGRGILVLSHTNSAVDEIKEKIHKYCPKLFSYPNFVGTIQSFVDTFLALPCGHNLLKSRFSWIDKDKYEETLLKKFHQIAWLEEYGEPTKWFYSRFITRATAEAAKEGKFKKEVVNGLIDAEVKSLYYDFNDDTIKSFKTLEVVLKTPDNLKFIGLKKIILEVLQCGIISFDYAYCLAKYFISKIPNSKIYVQERFAFVFVDEMQDMDNRQYELLETIFHFDAADRCIYQRIGDKNQAIYHAVNESTIWVNRIPKLPLQGSQRLSRLIGEIVNQFAIEQDDDQKIVGLKECPLKAHLLVFDDDSTGELIPFYVDIVEKYKIQNLLPDYLKYPICVIAWNADWKNLIDAQNIEKLRLIDFYGNYNKTIKSQKPDYENYYAYLEHCDKNKNTLESFRKNILNGLVKLLRIENLYNTGGRFFTKRSMLQFINEYDLKNGTENLTELKLHIYNWSIKVLMDEIESVHTEVIAYADHFVNIWSKPISCTGKQFCSQKTITQNVVVGNQPVIEPFKVSTIHAAKGQTHCATLYIESYYDGHYESEILSDAFLMHATHDSLNKLREQAVVLKETITNLNGAKGSKARQTDLNSVYAKIAKVSQCAKMAYVGLSRSTNLLCYAVHKKRYELYLKGLDREKWQVEFVAGKEY
ncbi:hypothetical protein A0256_15455 [Mucilaginibacter sp. PAMC 26640]|nr:hypothetical protein A0256_15455 [Mucilaginibacter sp. PAMC 26640]